MAPVSEPQPLAQVGQYYAQRLAEHGATARGVDWNGDASQRLRFVQLLHLVDRKAHFSLNDLGCGYGALFDYLCSMNLECDYLGIDMVPEMIVAARAAHAADPRCQFKVGTSLDRLADYTVTSGIFNVRLGIKESDWERMMLQTLDQMHESSSRGFAFNCLTQYGDQEKMRPDLHYASPAALFDYCKRRYSRNVALLHDYDLYEFTLLIRKAG